MAVGQHICFNICDKKMKAFFFFYFILEEEQTHVKANKPSRSPRRMALLAGISDTAGGIWGRPARYLSVGVLKTVWLVLMEGFGSP